MEAAAQVAIVDENGRMCCYLSDHCHLPVAIAICCPSIGQDSACTPTLRMRRDVMVQAKYRWNELV